MNTTLDSDKTEQLYDVAIVGGGITGALLAWSFMEQGFSCLMLEKNRVGQGSTRISTALLQYEPDMHMGELAFRYGDRVALQAYAATRKGLQQIEELAKTLPDEVSFRLRKSIYLASQEEDVVELLDEILYREDHGFESLFLSRKELADHYGIQAHGALLNPYAGQMNAGAFSQALLNRLVEKGMVLREETAVEAMRKVDEVYELDSSRGRYTAKQLVVAAGYEALKYLDLPSLGVSMQRTYVVEGNCPELRGCGDDFAMIWETARPYFYARTLSDHGDILLGGGDVPLKQAPNADDLLVEKQAELLAQFRAYFPAYSLRDVKVRSGVFVDSEDGLPVLAPLQGIEGAYTLVGCGGNDILFALWAARCLAELYATGKSNQLDILLPNRKERFGSKVTAS